MNALSRISLPELSDLHQPPSEELSLARTSQPLVSDACVDTLTLLMAETQARYPQQVLPEGTPDMYLAEWERMVHRYGLREFRDALQLVLQDRERPRFFPDPLEIEDRIRAMVRARSERQRTLDELDRLEKAKAQWRREREEEKVTGRQYTEAELRMDRRLKAIAARQQPKPAAPEEEEFLPCA